MRTLNKLKIDEEGIVKENIKDNIFRELDFNRTKNPSGRKICECIFCTF